MSDPIEIPIVAPFDSRGVDAAIKAFEQLGKAETKAAQAQATAAQAAARVSTAHSTAAVSAQKLAQAQNQTAASSAKLAQATAQAEAAQSRAAAAALRLQQAQQRVADGAVALPRTFAGLSSEMQSAAASMLSLGAAMTTASAVAGSFKDAFNFKTELDATTASVNIQLQGVRDSGQVWSEASAYAQQYKLTQAETTATVQASIGILRQSQASIEDTFGVLQRLTVLAPGKSIEDAAFSVRELASGDITSIAEQFNISRAKAYEMRDAIASGADVVTVLSGFLDASGVSMDSLKVRTEGAAGAIKDAAIAAEELKLAQAELANGPGLALLQLQIEATRGTTRLLTGDFASMGDSLVQAFADGSPMALALAQSLGVSGAQAQAAAQQYLEHNAAMAAGTTGGSEWGATQLQAADASTQVSAALTTTAQALIDETAKKAASAEQARLLAELQAQLAQLGGAVAGGLLTSANAAATLASQYGITAAQAEVLIAAQARLAGGQARLAGQKAQTRTLAQPGFNAPGRSGASDADILATVNKTSQEVAKAEEKAQTARVAAVKSGGSARAAAASSSASQLVSIEQAAADKIVAINAKMVAAQAAAQRSLAATIATSTQDMIANQEADDLDLIGAKEENIAKLQAREAAQANARIAQAQAVAEAQATAAAGDAALAEDVLGIREQAIAKQTALDEDYNNKRNELAGDETALAAAKQQYDEATQAAADAAAVRVGLAQSEAEQKAQAIQQEKDAAIAAAGEAASALGATGKQADSAAGQVNALIGRLNAIPASVTTTINVKTVGGSGGSSSASGGSAKAAGGLHAVTSGPTTLTVGDNPGGVEAVSVVPISGMGTTTVSGNSLYMAGGGTAVVGDAASAAQKALDEANKRAAELAGSAGKAVSKSGGGGSGGGGGSAAAADPGDAAAAIDKALSLLDKIADLRDKLADVGPPLDMAVVNALADEAFAASQVMGARFVQLSKEQGENFSLFTGALEDAIGALSDAAGLRNDLIDIGPPLDEQTINQLADTALAAANALGSRFKAISKKEGEAISDYTDAASKSLSLLADAGKVSRQAFSDYQPPSDAEIAMFVADADRVVQAIDKAAQAYSTDGLTAAGSFADVAGTVFDTIGKGLEVFDKIRFGDLTVDPANLAMLEKSTLAVLDTTQTIAARAAQIPAGDLSSLGLATSAINAQAEALINLAAVPFGNLQGASQGLGQSNTSSIGAINIYPAPGMDVNALANLVMQKISSQLGARK